MKALQRIIRHGNSAQVTIPRPILFKLDLMFGDHILLTENGDGTMTLRKWNTRDDITRTSPGMIDPNAPPVLP